MGLTIEVAHIVRKPPNPPAFPGSQLEAAWYEQRWGLLGRICEQFGWRRVPWAEPGERAEPGRASFGRGRYHDLLRRAALEARFPHLTSRQDDGYLALYLPVALPAPVVIDAGSGFHSWGRITIGSSVQLGSELERLIPSLNESWAGVADIAATIGAYCAESQALNLPMWVEW